MTGEPIEPHATQAPDGPSPARRLLRRRDDRMLGGVASGLADYLDADPALVRIAWVALAFLTSGFGLLAYIAGWIVIPEEGGSAADAATAGRTHTQRSTEPGNGAWGGVIWGVILIAVGAVALLRQFDLPVPSWRAAISVALIVVGLAMIAAARRGLHSGLLLLAILLAAALATGVRMPHMGVGSGFGDRRVVIAVPGDLQQQYGHAFGSMRLELAGSALPPGTTALETSIAFGELRVTVPSDVGLRVTATTAFGSARVLDEELGAFGDARVIATPGYDQAAKRIDLRTTTAFGSTRVARGQP